MRHATDVAGATAGHSRRMLKHPVRAAVLVLVAGASLYLLLPSLLAVFASWHMLAHARWPAVLAALAAEAAAFVCIWDLDRIALGMSSWFAVSTSQLSGNAVGRILPGGGATAVAVSVSMLRETGVDTGTAAAGLGAASALQIAATLALPVFALPAIAGGAPVDHGLAVAAYIGLGVLFLLLVAAFAAFAGDRPLELAGRGIERALNATVRRRRPIHGLPQRLLADRDHVAATLGRRWPRALVAAAASTAFDYLALIAALLAVGANPRPSLVLLAFSAARLLGLIPVTPGGLGFVEAGLVGTLTLAGVSGSAAVSATLLYRLVSFWLPVPAGGAAYVLFRRRYRSLRSFRTQSAVPLIRSTGSPSDDPIVNRTTWRYVMESMFDRATKTANTQLTKMRWALGLNGLLALAVGVVILVWPNISLYALTILFGAYSLASGVVAIGAALQGAAKGERAWLVVYGLLGIAVGVMVVVWPGISELALLYVIGAYAVALGILAVVGAFYLPLDGGDTALMILSGVVSILFGIVIFAKPGEGALVVLALIAAFALITGITELIVAIGGKRLFASSVKRTFTPRPNPS